MSSICFGNLEKLGFNLSFKNTDMRILYVLIVFLDSKYLDFTIFLLTIIK